LLEGWPLLLLLLLLLVLLLWQQLFSDDVPRDSIPIALSVYQSFSNA
jgi:hypothetical protein